MRMSHAAQLKRALVLAVTSGKGGVGKTNLAINVSVALSRLGHRVAIVDADFGLGNVDVMLGLAPQGHVGHLLTGERTLDEVLVEGPRGLQVLPAGSGVQPLTSLTDTQRARFDAAIDEARARFDFIVIDTATGISSNVIDVLHLAHHVLLVTSLDPSALVDAYALAKVLWRTAARADIGLIVNRVEDGAEGRLAFRQLDRAATRFLGQHLRYFGYIPRDPAVRDAMLHQAALVDHLPQTPASRGFRLLANRLASLNTGPGGVRLLPVAGDAGCMIEVPQCA
jgi:flagellar biosynthesis protein FlhG